MDDPLTTNYNHPVLTVTLDRPEVRNALNTALVQRLLDVLHQAKHNPDVTAIVLTGTAPAFCAGGDLSDVPPGADAATLAVRHREFVEVAHQIASFPKPIVAAINGPAVGAGASLALACDHVVMAADTTLKFSFLAVGLPPDLLSTTLLRNRAGSTVAADILYSGRAIDAQEAVNLHLANQACAASDIQFEATEIARHLGRLPTFAFATTKSLLRHAATIGDALVDFEPLAVGVAAASQDFHDAISQYRR